MSFYSASGLHYSDLRQQLAQADGQPATLALFEHEKWYLTDPALGSPAQLVVCFDALLGAKSGFGIPEVVATAARLREGYPDMHFGSQAHYYVDNGAACLSRLYAPLLPGSDLALTLLYESLCLKLIAEYAGMSVGPLTFFYPTTPRKGVQWPGLPLLPAYQPMRSLRHEAVPDYGPALLISDPVSDPQGIILRSDIERVFLGVSVGGASRWVRRVLSPLAAYRKTKDTSLIDGIEDPYIRESLRVHSKRMV